MDHVVQEAEGPEVKEHPVAGEAAPLPKVRVRAVAGGHVNDEDREIEQRVNQHGNHGPVQKLLRMIDRFSAAGAFR